MRNFFLLISFVISIIFSSCSKTSEDKDIIASEGAEKEEALELKGALVMSTESVSVAQMVKNVILEMFYVEPGDVVPAASFVDDLLLDDLDVIELLMRIEEEFDHVCGREYTNDCRRDGSRRWN